MKNLVWNVYYFNCNAQKIEKYNVLGGKYFLDELKKMIKKHKDKNDFIEALKNEMMYRYWSRAEYELIIKITSDNRIVLEPWCGCRNPEETRIDVTDDTNFKWKDFAEEHIRKQIYDNKAKIDIYDQIRFNWDDFVEYILSSKKR